MRGLGKTPHLINLSKCTDSKTVKQDTSAQSCTMCQHLMPHNMPQPTDNVRGLPHTPCGGTCTFPKITGKPDKPTHPPSAPPPPKLEGWFRGPQVQIKGA